MVDLITRLPVEVWFHTNPLASETKFETSLLSLVSAKTLLLLDRGFYNFQFFEQLMGQQVDFITRIKAKASLRFDRISLEMVYRGLYHFTVAYDKAKATDPIQYFADPSNQDLGVVKALRKPQIKLALSPFPLPFNAKRFLS